MGGDENGGGTDVGGMENDVGGRIDDGKFACIGGMLPEGGGIAVENVTGGIPPTPACM